MGQAVGTPWGQKGVLAMAVVAVAVLGTADVAGAAPPIRKQLKNLASDVEILRGSVESSLKQIQDQQSAHLELSQKAASDTKELKGRLSAAFKEIDALKAAAKKSSGDLGELDGRLGKLETHAGDAVGQVSPHVRIISDLRVRGELFNNKGDLSSARDDKETLYTQRLRLGAVLDPFPFASVTIAFQDARVFGALETPSTDDQGVGLWQGYITLRPPFAPGLEIDAGRMALSYGSGLLIGADDWSFAGRSFDGIRLRYRLSDLFHADVFWALIRERRTPIGGDVDLAGVVVGTDALDPFVRPELYLFYLRDGIDGPGRRQLFTLGFRAEGEPVEGLSYEVEAAVQLGSVGYGSRKVDRLATAYHVRAGYLLDVPAQPGLVLDFYAASGDGNPADDQDVSFDPLFPDTYYHLDPMGLFRLSNLIFAGIRAEARPLRSLRLEAGLYLAYLSSTRGSIAGLGPQGAPLRNLGRNIGKEIHVAATYARAGIVELKIGYAAFFPDDAATASLGGTDRMDWVYGQARVGF